MNETVTARMVDVEFVCPECRLPLTDSEGDLRCPRGHSFKVSQGVYHLLPSSVNPLALEDAQYHSAQKDTWLDHNQSAAFRNVYFHESLLRLIAKHSDRSTRILEIGGGVGFDLQLFLRMQPAFGLYVFSEISQDLAAHVASQHHSNALVFCTSDAQRLPFADGYFDCVYMMAALHHLDDLGGAMEEFRRVTRVGGLVCCGIEPNAWWLWVLSSTKGLWRGLLPQRSHSPADEQAHGLTIKDFHRLGDSLGLGIQRLEPVWLCCGFLHYGLEFFYRLLRLKQRLRVPVSLEKACVACDRLLMKLPVLKRLSWHYTVVYQKF